jgi:hypothetical protein
MKFALKRLGLCWGIGFGCVFIPVMHFVLVPTAFLVGIISSYKQLKLPEQIVGGELTCPKCSERFTVDAQPFEWPKRLECQKCDSRLLIQPS